MHQKKPSQLLCDITKAEFTEMLEDYAKEKQLISSVTDYTNTVTLS